MIEHGRKRILLLKLALVSLLLAGFLSWGSPTVAAQSPPPCGRTISAKVVAFDQIIFYNRFGSFDPGGMMYALLRDVVPIDTAGGIAPGNVQLRGGKRPRPIVLRVNEGDCLQVTFTNLLDKERAHVEKLEFINAPDRRPYYDKEPFFGEKFEQINGDTRKIEKRPVGNGVQVVEYPADGSAPKVIDDGEVHLEEENTPATRAASIHINGIDYTSILSDGANVGRNPSSLVKPGNTITYLWYAQKQGQYLLYSMGAHAGGEGDGGQPVHGLFGMLVVEPKNSKWYRSQVTKDALDKATIGRTTLNQPLINYDANFPNTTEPILNMLKGNEIVYTDLNAIVTGFGLADDGCLNSNGTRIDPPSGTCGQPFREFGVLFHDELETGKPAFPELLADESVFHSVRDGFGINYGSSGFGAILLANRKQVGPSAACRECPYEEFFLESWPNGDPALLVKNDPVTGKATQAVFPEDPSNVHHSYLGDPVRFRNVHAGPKETHVFHLHAHQWLQTPRDQNSTYLDSQTISPGAAFTYEINFGGGGNRNFTPGDAIFHCHLYPHFAQGMWELWRNHDVFEQGSTDRNVPDGEIEIGVPTPAVVPLPNKPMPLMPSLNFKGYPFYIAADAGHRATQPPLSLERDGGLRRHKVLDAKTIDGINAIPAQRQSDPVFQRVRGANGDPNLVNFARVIDVAKVQFVPLSGTPAEKVAMDFHAGRFPGGVPVTTQYDWPAIGYPSFTATGGSGPFLVNGRPEQSGAPYAEPCPPTFQPDVELGGRRTVPLRRYRSAWIQFAPDENPFGPQPAFVTLKINRAGWHDRQGRITVLEDDALPMLQGELQPDPLFFRANSGDCIDYRVTNLVPGALNLDDFQVYQPTDMIGQHIHLVKFDVTSSDGAANGFNYESGAFSPEEVRHRIEAIRKANGCVGPLSGDPRDASDICPVPQTNPKFGPGPNGDWVGAQTLIERWWADPIMNRNQRDRTLRTVFTHDHFSPSGHQHHGMYAGLVIEPTDSRWNFIDGTVLGGPVGQVPTRTDGGPVNRPGDLAYYIWAANILWGPNDSRSHREFNLEIADFAIVYTKVEEGLKPVNPPNHIEKDLPIVIGFPDDDPAKHPFPEAISSADPGTQVINYKNEPIPLRIGERNSQTGSFSQKPGVQGNLAFAFSSVVHGDPFTPLLKGYPGDRIQIRLLQGAQEEQHVMNVHAHKWFFEPGTPHDPTTVNNSGYTNSQAVGISEHFEFDFHEKLAPVFVKSGRADTLYQSAPVDNLWDGQWGILRAFKFIQRGLAPLPSNSSTAAKAEGAAIAAPDNPLKAVATEPDDGQEIDQADADAVADPNVEAKAAPDDTERTPSVGEASPFPSNGINRCPTTPGSPPIRKMTIEAWIVKDLLVNLPVGQLGIVYNPNFVFHDPAGLVYINALDRAAIRSGQKLLEPLVVRANAGECIEVKLRNHTRQTLPEYWSFNHLPPIINEFNFNQIQTSNRFSLHPQLLGYDVSGSDGSAVGVNPVTTVRPGRSIRYAWYAGTITFNGTTPQFKPVEFGVTHLRDYGDVIKHSSHGAIGALVIEPAGTVFREINNAAVTINSGAQADIRASGTNKLLFREFVVHYQDDVTMQNKEGKAMMNIRAGDDAEDSGMKAFNYKTEPFWARLGFPPETDLQTLNDQIYEDILSSKVGNKGCTPTPQNPFCDPATPIFSATAGTQVRFRVLQAAGHPRQHGFTIFGHHWQYEPWTNNSTALGSNPLTFEVGSQSHIGPTRHVNILITAGGALGVTGDFLYRTQESLQFSGGLWGIFRVGSTP